MPSAKKDHADPERAKSARTSKADQAFDLWLQRGLHQLFDSVASEPVPEELRRLIEDDRAE